jgi:hypothetical protein
MLMQLAETADTVEPDWQDALRRAGYAARRPRAYRRLRRSRVAVLASGVAVLLIAGGAVAAVAVGPWWEEGEPPANPEVVERQLVPHEDGFPPAADRARARTVARADGAALVAAPVGESGYCLIPSLPGSPDIGFSCTYQVKTLRSGAGDEFRSYARPPADGEPRWIVYGRITDPRARVLDLSEAAGVTLKINLTPGGFFLANVPAERWGALANTAAPGRILDAAGDTLRTGCINWGPSPHSRAAGESRFGFWSEGAAPCRARPVPTQPSPLFSQAEKLVEMTLRDKYATWEAGTKIAVWRTPTREGGECVYIGSATLPGGQIRDLPALPGGGVCRLGGRVPVPPPAQALTAELGWSRHGRDNYSIVIQGQVKAAERTTRVVLRTPVREEELAYSNGFYLAQLPNSAAAGRLPPGGPYTVVAYDASDREVARLDLADWLRNLRSPGG